MDRKGKPVTQEYLAERLVALCRRVGALEVSVQTLANRIAPAEGEQTPAAKPWITLMGRPEATPELFRTLLRQCAAHIENMERDFAALRSKVERMDEGAYLRDELSPWMKPKG